MQKISMKYSFGITRFLLAFGIAFLLGGCVFREAPQEPYSIDLEVWGVFDDTDAYAEIFSAYQKINPYVGEIRYRKLQPENYQEELLNALAANKGPDIFMIQNTWTPAFSDKIQPAPDNFSEKNFREAFVDVMADDFIGPDSKIYGSALSVDSLALYYNKDLLNASGIANPPTTWEELASETQTLTRLTGSGNFDQSAVALGTARNINRSTDIFLAMNFQLGVDLSSEQNTTGGFSGPNSRKALEFYTQFANISSPQYTWNAAQDYSIDAFYEGRLAMMANYSWQYAAVKQKNAKLNIGIAPLPQFIGGKQSNVANYWGYVVAKNKEYVPAEDKNAVITSKEMYNTLRQHEAWQLLRYMTYPHPTKTITLENGITKTTKDFPLAFDPSLKYLEDTKKPAARRDLIETQQQDLILGPFASGNLIAESWQQSDTRQSEAILADTIESVVRGERSIIDALSVATNRLQELSR